METRRFLLFIVLSTATLFAWNAFVVPKFLPPAKQAAKQVEAPDDAQADDGANDADRGIKQAGDDDSALADAGSDSSADSEQSDVGDSVQANDDVGVVEAVADADKPAEFDEAEVILGSDDPETGYFLKVALSSRGAVVDYAELNDPRYRELEDDDALLKVVGNSLLDPKSLATNVERIDELLEAHGTNLREVHWELVDTTADRLLPGVKSAATFRYPSPDGMIEVLKHYELSKSHADDPESRDVRDEQSAGYQLTLTLTIRNLSDGVEEALYSLQGPTGIPLENRENTRKYRDVKSGYYAAEDKHIPVEERKVNTLSWGVSDINKAIGNQQPIVTKSALQYIGVDSQYFAALVIPNDDQLTTSYLAQASPEITFADVEKEFSDVSVLLRSKAFPLKPQGNGAESEIEHSYTVYLGPKRETLLEPLRASSVIDYGWFGFVSKPMLQLLNFFYSIIPSYGIAIICLTVMVRGCMYPLSRKQAKGAQKMKELQPKIAELRKKYENDKEKMAKAQMELFGKHNYNPLAGCLPVLMQFPIFIGLYQALNNSVDLRRAEFLWIDNLAAPDALFDLPGEIPILHWTVFNLLPILTIGLFIAQQKMFMPPAAPGDEQAQMQQKMMKYMMVFMGFLFYTVPAGLCVYFIASSLWGMGERKLLDLKKKNEKPGGSDDGDEPPSAPRKPTPDGNKKEQGTGLWAKLVASAEQAAQQSKSEAKRPVAGGQNGAKRSGKKNRGKKTRR